MTVKELFENIESKSMTGKDMVDQALCRPRVIMSLVEGLFAWDHRVAYECAGLLQLISRAAPNLIYPHFNSLSDVLAHADSIRREDVNMVLRRLELIDCQGKGAFLSSGRNGKSAPGLSAFPA